jgi:hypothetical protein
MNLRSFFFSLLLALSVVPMAFAQSNLSVQFQASEELEIDGETIVTIEVTEDGEPVEVDDMNVSYIPADGVFDDVLYDCNDPDMMENCRANNRGVAGIFEAVFDLKKLPLTVVVNADGTREEMELQLAAMVTAPEKEVVEVVEEVIPAVEAAQEVISPASIQAGPSPAWWVIFAPLVLMCLVVMYFVVKTTD